MVGGIVSLLIVGLWWTEPRRIAKWLGVTGLVIAIGGFGELHRGLMAQGNVLPVDMQIPMGSVVALAVGFSLVFATALLGLLLGVKNAGLRLLGTAALLAVMIQGLLGGFRVKLNELVGTDLAAVHGIFAQVVLSLLILLAVLTEKLSFTSQQSEKSAKSLGMWAFALTALLFVQIIWGAIIRHDPTPLMQRLHFLTAFLALTIAVLLLRAVFANAEARSRIGWIGLVLGGLLVAQLYLGVEAWLVKFGAYTLPELVPITTENATIRTLHALIGSGILMSSLTLAVRLRRTLGTETPKQNVSEKTWIEPSQSPSHAIESAARFSGNTP
jgi:heme A synthase